MNNLIPAGNIQIASLAGAVLTIVTYVITTYVHVPGYVQQALVVIVMAIVAHICDIITGQNPQAQRKAENDTAAKP